MKFADGATSRFIEISMNPEGATMYARKLSGNVALVTGAGRGQGEAHARELASLGAAVVLFDGPDNIESVRYPMATAQQTEAVAESIRAAGGRALAVQGDVRSRSDLDNAVALAESNFGSVDMLVANAGIWGEIAPIWETTDIAWTETMAINLTGTWNSIQAVVPRMIEAKKGSIVLVSSVVGIDEPLERGAPYTVSKHAVVGLLRSAASELGAQGIRVNAICPGFIDTDMHRWQDAYDLMAGRPGGTPADLVQAGRHYAALRGNAGIEAHEVSKTVAFLLSDDASVLTGVILPVDAGHSILFRVNQSPVVC